MIYKKVDNSSSKSVVKNAKYLDRKLKNSKNALLLHSVSLEHNGESIIIDHLLISRMGIEILKSKNFDNQEILIGGDSALIIDSRQYSNPLERVEREKKILENFLADKLTLGSNNFWFIDSKINIEATVVFSKDSHIINDKLPAGFDIVDNYLSHREEKISKMNRVEAFKVLVNMLSADTIQEIALLLSSKREYSNDTIQSEELVAS